MSFSALKFFPTPILPLPTLYIVPALALGAAIIRVRDTIRAATTETISLPLDVTASTDLTDKIVQFQTVLGADLGKAATYVVRQPGILAVDSLISGARVVFEGYADRVPEIAKQDTDQAGRCIAFDVPTAAGFHIARATESVLLEYLKTFGQTVSKETQRNWGQYTKIMRDNKAGASEKVLTTIDQIRVLHRNPLLHPEVTLRMPEALSLWAICCSAIQAMVADMERKRAEPKSEILEMLPEGDFIEAAPVAQKSKD